MPLKVAFTSAEWCGHVDEELNRSGATWSRRVSSYFDGEATERTLEIPTGGGLEDELFILLRGLRGPYPGAGASRTVPLLASPFYRRLTHRALSRAPRARRLDTNAACR